MMYGFEVTATGCGDAFADSRYTIDDPGEPALTTPLTDPAWVIIEHAITVTTAVIKLRCICEIS
jgi:hypothetical protein